MSVIKKRTPEWWDGWCWFALVMLVWSIGWAVFGSNPMARGFQIGMAIYWVGFLIWRAGNWYATESAKLADEIINIKDQIILEQQGRINIKNETIEVQRATIIELVNGQ